MKGLRLTIAKQTVSSILDTLGDDDFFNIITVSVPVLCFLCTLGHLHCCCWMCRVWGPEDEGWLWPHAIHWIRDSRGSSKETENAVDSIPSLRLANSISSLFGDLWGRDVEKMCHGLPEVFMWYWTWSQANPMSMMVTSGRWDIERWGVVCPS